MKWERLTNGDYQAQGGNGDFLIWKYGKYWKCRYRSKDHKKFFFLCRKGTIGEAKKQAEKNYYWEEKI